MPGFKPFARVLRAGRDRPVTDSMYTSTNGLGDPNQSARTPAKDRQDDGQIE